MQSHIKADYIAIFRLVLLEEALHKLTLSLLLLFAASPLAGQPAPVDCVNPFIGTTNYGTCNPGAVVPHGLMSCTPFNVMGSTLNHYDKDTRWWSTPYDHTNAYFTGMAHVNLSGVGCPELGGLLTCPTTGALDVDYHAYGSPYAAEEASPGYYAVRLTKYDVGIEATATLRTSRERYTFPAGEAHVVLNLGDGLTNETGAALRRTGEAEWEGWKLMGTFCYSMQSVFPLYFVVRLNRVPRASGYWKRQRLVPGVKTEYTPEKGKYRLYTDYARWMGGDDVGLWTTYDVQAGEQVEVSLGVSLVSCENARENLNAEQPAGTTFEALHDAARRRWADALGRIEVEGGTADQRTIFYTALYHTLLHPNILQDVNGEYPLMESDSTGRCPAGQNRYTVFSLWDTYRNVSPLLTLLYPDVQREMLRSMVDMARESGWMPKWELYGRETHTMDGDPAAPYIADAYARGLRGFPAEEAYTYLRRAAFTPCDDRSSYDVANPLRRWNTDYIERGYIPLRERSEVVVSECLEYCAADHALAGMADALGHADDARQLRERSLSYRRYYDKSTGALRPLLPDGSFLSPFDPGEGANFSTAPGFHEGSAWNYTFAAAHDAEGLARLMGGRRRYVARLEHIFQSGLYDPTNEPDIIYPYLFSHFKGEEHRTQRWARWALDKYFRNAPDGLPGNDDTGTLSAWALFTMMGFYPDVPGDPTWTLTAPVFKRTILHLDPKTWGRSRLVILADGDDRLTNVRQYRLTQQQLLQADTLRLF